MEKKSLLPKILYIWKSKYPWDVRVEKICKSLVRHGFEVYILARWTGEKLQKEQIEGIKIFRAGYGLPLVFSSPVSYNPFWKNAINKAVEEIKPDLIIVREMLLAEASGKISKKNKIPVIMDMAEHYPAAMKDWKKYDKTFLRRFIIHTLKIPDRIERNSVKLMDGIITVCSEQNTRLTRDFQFNPEKIEIVQNTPDLKFFEGFDLFTNEKKVTFLHHGWLTSEKRIDIFLKGFIIAQKKHPDIRFIIAGSGDCLADLKEIAIKSDYPQNIKFYGEYTQQELLKILSKSDFGVIPYQVSDFNNHTIHNKIFDYFATGKPVLVSKALPIQRLIKETNSGLIVDCSNPVKIAEGIYLMIKSDIGFMSANALKASKEKYNWNVDEKKLIVFLNKFLNVNAKISI